jgi:hypothetical protein
VGHLGGTPVWAGGRVIGSLDLGALPVVPGTPLDLKGEAHEHLLAGINHLIGHGWPYSPADGLGLGWFFYAAGALDDRNPWWPAMSPLVRYLNRLCLLMRQGSPVSDVLVYICEQDVFARMGTAVGGSLDAWREAREVVGDEVIRVVREGGWDFDLIDDDALAVLPPTSRGRSSSVEPRGCPQSRRPGSTGTSQQVAV